MFFLLNFLRNQMGAIKRAAVGGIAGSMAALAVSVELLGGFEGLRNTSYRDVVGVWTVCYGETRGVTPGMVVPTAECDKMLALRILEFEREIDGCLRVAVPIEVKIAIVSWAYNVGSGAACRSTLMRKANAGDLKGACNELPRWNRAGGRVIRGLTNRRLTERTLCLSGLKAA